MEKWILRVAFLFLMIGGAMIAVGALYAVPNTVFYVELWRFDTLPRFLEMWGFIVAFCAIPTLLVWTFVTLFRSKKNKRSE